MRRKGGTAVALRNLTSWCFILTLLGVLVFARIAQVRTNYRQLWERVIQIENEIREIRVAINGIH